MYWTLFAVMLLQPVVTQCSADSGRECFSDPVFEQGVRLSTSDHMGGKEEIGRLQTSDKPANDSPSWRISQWGTRFLLEPGACAMSAPGVWGIENQGKKIVFDRSAPSALSLLLEARAIPEYNGRLRADGEAWPHLLIEQGFREPILLDKVRCLSFSTAMRIPFCTVDPACKDALNPGLHTTQVSAYWTVHNLNEKSPDAKEMFWFGIPFFDARYPIPPANYALDGGKADATHKFICLLEGKRFWNGNTGDGQWRELSVNLADLVREGLQITQQHGHMLHTAYEDLGLTSFNLGWEAAGPYNAALEVRGLSMKAEMK